MKIISKDDLLSYDQCVYLIKSLLPESIEVQKLQMIGECISFKNQTTPLYNGCGFKHTAIGKNSIYIKKSYMPVERYLGNEDQILEILLSNLSNIGNFPLVSGGHYMPNVDNLSLMPLQPLTALEYALKTIDMMVGKDIQPSLIIYINDIHLNGNQRLEFYKNFYLPVNATELIRQYGCKFPILIVSENKLAEKLKRKRKRLVEEGKLIRDESGVYSIGKHKIFDQKNKQKGSVALCVRACIELMTIPRILGYTGFLQIFPICGASAEKGNKISEMMYGDNLARITLRITKTCYSD